MNRVTKSGALPVSLYLSHFLELPCHFCLLSALADHFSLYSPQSPLDPLSSLSTALLPEPWLPNPPLLLRKLSRRSRTRSPVGYVWSHTNSQSCSSVNTCTANSACKIWYVGDRVSYVHNVARTLHCHWVGAQGSKVPSTSTASLIFKVPSAQGAAVPHIQRKRQNCTVSNVTSSSVPAALFLIIVIINTIWCLIRLPSKRK